MKKLLIVSLIILITSNGFCCPSYWFKVTKSEYRNLFKTVIPKEMLKFEMNMYIDELFRPDLSENSKEEVRIKIRKLYKLIEHYDDYKYMPVPKWCIDDK
jgi:hypothetical protein